MTKENSKKRYYFTFTLYFVVFGVIVAVSSSFINYNAAVKKLYGKLYETASLESKNKRSSLSNYISKTERILSSIAKNELTLKFIDSKSSKDRDNLNNLFYGLSYANSDVMQLRYIDASGKEVIRIDRDKKSSKLVIISEDIMQDKSQRYYFKETSMLSKNQFWHSNIDLNVEHGEIELPLRPTLRVATQLFVESGFEGIIIVNLLFENRKAGCRWIFFFRMIMPISRLIFLLFS